MQEGAWIFAAVVILALLLDLFERFMGLFKQDTTEGEMLPDRWFVWGVCLSSAGKSGHHFRYILIRLPSYSWQQMPWRGERWMQYALLRFAGQWRVTFVDPLPAQTETTSHHHNRLTSLDL